MPAITGEGYVNNKVNGDYYMFLTVDGQKLRRPTGTKDLDDAVEKLEEWKARSRSVLSVVIAAGGIRIFGTTP